jgi:hypothetical protein
VNSEEWMEGLWPWVRGEHRPALESAWGWLGPRCRTEEERRLAPVLLLLLSPLNALLIPCRPVVGSCVNFQVTLSRQGVVGPERVRLVVRAGRGLSAVGCRPSVEASSLSPTADSRPPTAELWLDADAAADDPLGSAAQVLGALLDAASGLLRRKANPGSRT